MQYDNTNTCAIFKNDQKEGSQPDYRGNLNVEGKDYEIALWVKESKAGKKFFSGKIQEPRKQSKPKQKDDDVDGDIPF